MYFVLNVLSLWIKVSVSEGGRCERRLNFNFINVLKKGAFFVEQKFFSG